MLYWSVETLDIVLLVVFDSDHSVLKNQCGEPFSQSF